ncbi:phosphomannomutase / phosphoglucomutase [Dyella jiangningensis]|uniref:phosphomannomutase/phosphoglucomutase n=1 Tax=Dyella sp. AtDHG13 TaxID=1938897 RepID=UPI00088DBA70|nr:phosphomannomutase/phosphoglucomutase [Dyella sp. AtDHG13]PXV53702.1 phosphomannomutase [Dyella sp. AtDHG13]SDL20658.1 phosphomannomutase / phosphoglucomutase [Dyella jiangningensis]
MAKIFNAGGNGLTGSIDGRALLPFALGILLVLGGLFCLWQTWQIADESSAKDRVHAAQKQAADAVAAEIASERGRVEAAVHSLAPDSIVADPAQAATELRQLIPGALKVDAYSGGLDEVLHANYRVFGYGKAAQLMAAQTADGKPPAQTVPDSGTRVLALVVPVGPATHPQAWVWVALPFAPIQERFESIPTEGGRLELRQGDDLGDLRLLASGSASAEREPNGMPVDGSTFSILAALPTAFIVLPHVWPVTGLLGLLGLAGGLYLIWMRNRLFGGRVQADVEEPVLSDLLDTAPEPETPAPARIAPPKPAQPAPVVVDPTIFRAYDVRGVVGKSLTKDVARLLGQAIGSVMREKGLPEIVIGRDGRLSGPELAGALSDGLREAGIDVIDLGAVPTPVVYYAAYRFNTGCGVAVTGSHNPPDYNGFKIVVGGETLSEGAIQDLYQRIAGNRLEKSGGGKIRHVDVVPDYIERITSDVQAERRLKIVVDCGNGIPGAVAPQVLEGIGCEVIPLYCDVDGTFPNHHPDPSDPHNLEDLIFAVKQTGADLGLAFDGDGDRLGVVTKDGEIIFPDRQLMLFARDVLSRQPGATIIYDVKCTGHLKGQILDAGGSPMMWRTGHSLIKAKMRETGAELAGEMSGHFFFKERWYGFDDGIYAGARLMEILAGDLEERTPEEIFATCPKGVSTPELKVEMAEGAHYRFMEEFRQKASFGDATLTTIDGVRADWPDGWGLVRPSNTTPVLVLRFDADNEAALTRIKNLFRQQMLAVDPSLKLPF